MKRTGRLDAVCAELSACGLFADVGCDHGYCTLYMLERGLCRGAVISDISAKSLQKAERLLRGYIAEGRVRSVCCAGLAEVPREAELVLIAGMGGEEILQILREGFLPPKLVLQPMKNAPKLRAFLLENGYAIAHDYTYFEGRKYYDILRAERGTGRAYSAPDLLFGYDNLKSPSAAFVRRLEREAEECRARVAAAGKLFPAAETRLRQLAEASDEAQRNLR